MVNVIFICMQILAIGMIRHGFDLLLKAIEAYLLN